MTNDKPLPIKILLAPIAMLYWLGTSIRNWLFEIGVLSQQKFEHLTVISIGNISMGGTGKTPFTEHIVRMLKEDNNVAILSRGYKRKTSGYRLATTESTVSEIGDEPYQMKQKFPEVSVGVDAKRTRGIERMLQDVNPRPDVFVLDDAFQHRYVKPDIAILLVDYNNLITDDHIFPIGRLREPLSAKDRANIVVVTKCPPDVKPIDLRIIGKELNLYPYQTLYFTTIDYQQVTPLFPDKAKALTNEDLREYGALCVSGIAKPELFEKHADSLCKETKPLRYADHHNFKKRNYQKMTDEMASMEAKDTIILTTEKDAMRMKCDENLPENLKEKIYYIPLEIKLVNNEDLFIKQIGEYVNKNKQYLRISEE
ncbi:MAG: tetraacyldisaccharide 4'-kinase [Paludibacteraceae bacterium]|nr:tetraacyldisaccharide 4'-kinase [Paludibacteraceae bacterium]